ncbi:hypothetical protein WICMUC_003725 [Wickerhamomyces mucosus]|uniref:Brl1/Brr6 domain-containing protein n=1 Tax=Wickerhamomyces mucosus TaxID=1378264 RepID=A0A9P8TCI6_9ASCO|nr:hypothetical protein WICMUC_003725 [Wickerhamomyces mucosus]
MDVNLDSLRLEDRDQEQDQLVNLETLSIDSKPHEEELILNSASNLSLNDNFNKDKDGDFSMEDSPISSTPIIKKLNKHIYTPRISSPLKIDNNELLVDNEEEHDVTMEHDDSSFTNSITKTATLVFSPTILGAKVATQRNHKNFSPFKNKDLTEKLLNVGNNDSLVQELDTESETSALDSSPINIKNRNTKPKTSSRLAEVTTSQTEDEEDTTDQNTTEQDSTEDSQIINTPQQMKSLIKSKIGNAPIHVQMHHHHYYPPSPSINSSSYLDDDGDETENTIILPSPWSKFASPKAPAPYLISSYLQLLFNALTSSIAIYVLISAILTVKSDINLKMEEYAIEIALEVSRCTRSYVENRCEPDTRVSALEELCLDWERCMNRDPRVQAGKASVSAETLGIILNSLIEPIGAKAIIVFGLGFLAWAFTSNFIFGFLRAKSYYGWNSNNDGNEQQQQLQYNQQQNQQFLANHQPPLGPLPAPNTPMGFYTPSGPRNWEYDYSTTPLKPLR